MSTHRHSFDPLDLVRAQLVRNMGEDGCVYPRASLGPLWCLRHERWLRLCVCGPLCLVTESSSWRWCVTHGRWLPHAQTPAETPARPTLAVTSDAAPLAARKSAEGKIEVVFAQLESAEELALLYRLLRRRGWSDDRSDAVLHKARW